MLTGSIDDPTATVIVTVDGIDYPATNNGDGSWTIADNTVPALAEGEHSISVTATDAVGHSDSATGNLIIDTVGVNVGIDALTTNDNTPALTGSIDDPTATVIVTVAGVDYPATNNGDGTWTLADNTLAALSDGETAVTVSASDAAGHGDSDSGTIIIDTVGLNVTIDALTTNDNTPALTGSIDDPTATVVVTVDGIDYPATNQGDGTWTLADNTLPALAEGEHSISVTASDAAGNTDITSGFVTIHVTSPIIADELSIMNESDLGIETPLSLQGNLSISETLDSLTLNIPTDDLTSQGELVTWTLNSSEDNLQILTGSTISSGDIAVLTLSNEGEYEFTLSAPLTHPGQGSDTLSLAFDVQSSDTAGNSGDTAQLVFNVIDDVPSINHYQQEVVETVNNIYVGDLVVESGQDGIEVSSVTLDGYTFSYDSDNNMVSSYGSSDLVKPFDESNYNQTTQILTIETIKGESITLDISTGEYTYETTGIADVEPVTESAPEVGLGEDNSLLGLIGAEALGLIDFSQNQSFSATDLNNDIVKVVITDNSLVSIFPLNFDYSEEMAEEFGLSITNEAASQSLLGLITINNPASITIESIDPDNTITNQEINEFLGSVYLSSSLGVSLLPTLTIEATDATGLTASATSSDLLNLDALSINESPSYIIEDVESNNAILTGISESDRLYGYDGDDQLNGGNAADILRGGAGTDELNGESGNDIIIGGLGNDTLNGGSGNDVFRWESVDIGSIDTITDFNMLPVSSGGDIIDLAELLSGEGKIGDNNVGNLVNFLHFEFDGTNTNLYINSNGDFQGGYDVTNLDQMIVFNNVDLTAEASSDQQIIENLLTNGNLLVDDLSIGDDALGSTTTIDVVLADGDGDLSQASVDFESSGAEPKVESAEDNAAPIVSASNTSLLGLVSVQALTIINADNQALTAIDVDGNLSSVTLDYQPLIDVNLATLTLDASTQMAEELGLQINIDNNNGLLGVVAPSSSLTITAIDGEYIDNQAINELLATVQFYENGELLNGALAVNVQADVLNNLTITATDSEGASASDTLGNLVSADALNDILFDVDNVIHEGDSGQNIMDYTDNTNDLRLYGYGDNDQITGGNGNDLIRGGEGDDLLVGSAGNDMLIDGNGADIFDGGEGDDLMVISGSEFISIDGGIGNDTLLLNDGINLDFTDTNIGSIDNIETIDLGEGDSGNILTLTASAVEALTDQDDVLIIDGDVNDSVIMEGASLVGSSVINGMSYDQYTFNDSTLFVDEEIGVQI